MNKASFKTHLDNRLCSRKISMRKTCPTKNDSFDDGSNCDSHNDSNEGFAIPDHNSDRLQDRHVQIDPNSGKEEGMKHLSHNKCPFQKQKANEKDKWLGTSLFSIPENVEPERGEPGPFDETATFDVDNDFLFPKDKYSKKNKSG